MKYPFFWGGGGGCLVIDTVYRRQDSNPKTWVRGLKATSELILFSNFTSKIGHFLLQLFIFSSWGDFYVTTSHFIFNIYFGDSPVNVLDMILQLPILYEAFAAKVAEKIFGSVNARDVIAQKPLLSVTLLANFAKVLLFAVSPPHVLQQRPKYWVVLVASMAGPVRLGSSC